MTSTPATPSAAPPTDADLIAAARRGDDVALDALIGRHREAAHRLAMRLAPQSADALVAEAVATATATLRSGGGPVVAFRPYLLTTIRRRNHARATAAGRVRPLDDLGHTQIPALSGSRVTVEAVPAATAVYRRISELCRVALWHTEVEGDELGAIAVHVGMPATEVAELAFRGRDAFRQGTLGGYAATTTSPACRAAAERFAAHAREALSESAAEGIDDHLAECPPCRAAYPAIDAAENDLRVLLAVVVLGPAAGPYLDLAPAGRTSARRPSGGRIAAGGTPSEPGAGRTRALVGAGGRSVVALGIGVLLAAGGLATSLAFAGDEGGTLDSATASPSTRVQTDRGDGSRIAGGASGSASAGGQTPSTTSDGTANPTSSATNGVTTGGSTVVAATEQAPAAIAPEAAPVAAAGKAEASPVRTAAKTEPETGTAEPAAERRVLANLGIVELALTPEGGLLPGLPGVGLLAPDA